MRKAIILLAVLLTGCRSEQQKSKAALQQAASSAAGVAFTVQAWLAAQVPTPFATNALSSAGKDFQKLAPQLPARARGFADSFQSTTANVQNAMASNDRARVAQHERALAQLSNALRELADAAEQSQ